MEAQTKTGIGHPCEIHRPIDLLLDRLDRVKTTGPGTWLASCPTSNHKHGDRSRGLSLREGDDGRVLLHCFAGCAAHEVVEAVGLELTDLFPAKQVEYPHFPPRHGFTGQVRRRIAWRNVFEGIQRDLRVCSLAFSDLARGKAFSQIDAATIARMADHLADEISGVMHG